MRQIPDSWITEHKDEMIRDIFTLCRIPSVRGDAEDGMPYGKEPARALAAMKELMEQYGLRTVNYDNYVVAGDLDGKEEKALDILAHLDVVPVSDTWTVTKPFEPVEKDGRIYGRGTSDDKGPAVAALYALRAIRESGIRLKKGVRLICGSDEECGSSDLEHYYGIEEEAAYSFTPDADFPLINIEKGRLEKTFYADGCAQQGTEQQGTGQQTAAPGGRVVYFAAGDKSNVIPGHAELVLEGIPEELLKRAAERTACETGLVLEPVRDGEKTRMHVKGTTGHASAPEHGKNALLAGLSFLKNVKLLAEEEGSDPAKTAGILSDAGSTVLLKTAELFPFGDHHGAALGVDHEDEESGPLTLSLDVLTFETKPDGIYHFCGCFDSRVPLCGNDENVTEKIRARLSENGFRMEEGGMVPPHVVPGDSEFVRTLLDSYEKYFGKKGEPIAIGGGTYVHGLKRGVAFGCAVEGVDNRMHGDDEFAEVDVLMKSVLIFADAIVNLCGAEE